LLSGVGGVGGRAGWAEHWGWGSGQAWAWGRGRRGTMGGVVVGGAGRMMGGVGGSGPGVGWWVALVEGRRAHRLLNVFAMLR